MAFENMKAALAAASSSASSGIGVVDLTVENDVEAELALHKIPGAMGTLEIIANQGGEVGWSWDWAIDPETRIQRPVSEATKRVITALINMELVREREHVTHAGQASGTGKLTLRLTDKGRNVVAKHRTRKVVAKDARILSVEEARAMPEIPDSD